jgi:hypothetical protein
VSLMPRVLLVHAFPARSPTARCSGPRTLSTLTGPLRSPGEGSIPGRSRGGWTGVAPTSQPAQRILCRLAGSYAVIRTKLTTLQAAEPAGPTTGSVTTETHSLIDYSHELALTGLLPADATTPRRGGWPRGCRVWEPRKAVTAASVISADISDGFCECLRDLASLDQ